MASYCKLSAPRLLFEVVIKLVAARLQRPHIDHALAFRGDDFSTRSDLLSNSSALASRFLHCNNKNNDNRRGQNPM
jgi:hypothetical protein